MRYPLGFLLLAAAILTAPTGLRIDVLSIVAPAHASGPAPRPADAQPGSAKPSPEEIMRRRHPQPVRVGDLIGLPVLDYGDSTFGRVTTVARTPEGKIELVVGYGGWFGWRTKPVAVPIEVVAILGRQIAALEFERGDFEKADSWTPANGQPIPPDEIIQIAITRR